MIRALLVALSLTLVTRSAQAQRTLSCEPLLGQDHDTEKPFLQQPPRRASRPSKRQLNVRWSGGTASFTDKAPYMEGGLEGTRYLYCGFNPELAMHLIYYQHDDLSEGLLLDDATGKRLPAGEIVVFSSDKTKYFASRQPNGLDGKEWRTYTRSGTLLWKGLSGIEARKEWTYFIANLEAPRWSARGELQATLTCAIGDEPHRTATVTLTRQKTVWLWLPLVDCPKA